jgi:hypothetical protein
VTEADSARKTAVSSESVRPAAVRLVEDATDFDLHGLVGVRLLGAGPAERRAVAGQLGIAESRLDREPDIIVRFVERLAPSENLGLLGAGDAAYGTSRFFLLRGKWKSAVRVEVPFERIGQRIEIQCERGVLAVPFLIAIINLTALGKNVVALHASAFVYRGVGVLVTGWSKGGKTEALLAFMARGARYVGDEWIYLPASGEVGYGVPEPIRVWDWHLGRLPALKARLSRRERFWLRMMRMVLAAGDALARRRGALGSFVRRALPLARKQACADVAPARLFGPDKMAPSVPVDRVVLVGSHLGPDTVVRPADPHEIARRMAFSLQYERREFLAAYDRFRFAFPQRRNSLIEGAAAREADLLQKILAGKPAVSVTHPYPFALEELPDLLDAFLRGGVLLAPTVSVLEASRSLDWRFLLDNPSLGRVVYDARKNSDLPRALSELGAVATPLCEAGDREAAGAMDFDVAVLEMPTAGSLRNAVAQLRPGGEIYVTGCHRVRWPRRRSVFGSLRQVTAAFRDLGLVDIRPYWHWPSLERCLEVVPLDDHQAIVHSLSRRGGGLVDRAKSWAVRLVLQAGILPRVIPAFGVVARKPGDARAR